MYKADGTKVYSAGDVVAESLTTGTDGQVVLSDLHLGTYVVTEIKSIDGYTSKADERFPSAHRMRNYQNPE
ncbi:MAG: prealbumin-like fold domain-containing protein [Roseburia sp.]